VQTTEKTSDDCKAISDDAKRDSCYLLLARSNNDYKACEKMSDMWLIKGCLHELAVKNENAEICMGTPDEISFQRNICIIEVAKKTLDTNDCNLINDDNQKQQCLSEINKRL
jgi:hypothetical protein